MVMSISRIVRVCRTVCNARTGKDANAIMLDYSTDVAFEKCFPLSLEWNQAPAERATNWGADGAAALQFVFSIRLALGCDGAVVGGEGA